MGALNVADDGERSAQRISVCRSAFELLAPEQDIVIVGGPGGTLKANRALDVDKRREIIKAVRGGDHVELQVRARTFRQRDGSPNKNFLRLNPEKLAEAAASFVNKPMLLDHRSWSQGARVGTILESEAQQQGHGWTAFVQTLHVVKPDAVISVLDGTLDRFSIGWSRNGGAVLCTVHKVDVTKRGSCGCWPGDVVDVEGAKQTVEFQWQTPEGTEVSGVNDPAVSGTRIEDVRAALAIELNLQRHEQLSEGIVMNLVTTLAAILGCAATDAEVSRAAEKIKNELADEKRARLAAEQERDTARTERDTAKKTAAAAVAKSLATQVDGLIEGAYKAGKLRYGRDDEGKAIPSKREARLRRIAKDDGIDALKAELDDMEVVVPLNKRQLDDDGSRGGGDSNEGGALASVAEQLGLDVKDVQAEYDNLYAKQEG